MKKLHSHINNFVKISEATFLDLEQYLVPHKLAKKEFLLKEGELCNKMFFILDGCVNIYFTKKNGQEQTIDFALENWWTTDFNAFNKAGESRFSIKAIENCTVIVLTKSARQKLLKKFPFMELYFREIFEKAYGASQYRMKLLYELSREELYFHFRDHFPEFIQRVPQYLIASFLGFTPEYLSEIRKKNIS